MPTRPGFLQPKPKIDEAEWAETQARTVRRLHAFFSPELAAAEAEAEAAQAAAAAQASAPPDAIAAEPLESQGSVAVADEPTDHDGTADSRPGLVVSGISDQVEAEPRPIVVYDGAAEIASIPLPEPRAAADVTDADLLDALEAGGRSDGELAEGLVGVMARPMDDLGWDDDRPLVGVFETPEELPAEPIGEVLDDTLVTAPVEPDASGNIVATAKLRTLKARKPRATKAKARPTKVATAKVATKPAAAKPRATKPVTVKSAAAKPAAVKAAAKPAAPKPVTAEPAVAKRVVAKPSAPKFGSAAPIAATKPSSTAVAHCPYCATLLDPAPTANRRCERCRHRIMVKKVNGAAVYLTEAALQVFDAERKRVSNLARWTKERDRWLRLAAAVGAPEERGAQLAKARLTNEVVETSRKLFVNTSDRAFWAARAKQDWVAAGRLRREKAVALHAGAGSPLPPSDEVIAIYREGVAAELRGISGIARDAELVGVNCCDACKADEGTVVRIARELKAPRLPHAGCPRGLCRCHWDLAEKDRLTVRRYLRRRSGSE